MVVQGKVTRILDTGATAIVELEIPQYQGQWLTKLDKDEIYSINIKKATSKKSLNQNNYSWQLMNDIAKELDQFPDAMEVYLTVLKLAKIKTHFLQVVDDEDILAAVKRNFRAFKILDRYTNDKGNKVATVEVSEGMSSFNKDEMTAFIEKLLYFAEQNGIDTSRYERGIR